MRLLFLAMFGAAVGLGSAASSAEKPRADPDSVICKQQSKSTTRFKSKVCRTRAQWDALAEQAKRDYASMRDRPTIETRKE